MDAYASVDNQTRRKMDEMLKTWKEPVPGSIDTRPVFPPDVVRPIENALIKARTTALQAQQESIRGQQQLLNRGRPVPAPYRNTPTPPGFRPGSQQTGNPYGQPPPHVQQGLPLQQAYPMHTNNVSLAFFLHCEQKSLTNIQTPQPQYPPRSTPQPAPSVYGAPPYQHHAPVPEAYGGPRPGLSIDQVKNDIQQLIGATKAQFAQTPHDREIQTRLKALLDLQTVLQTQSLNQDQLVLVKNQVAKLAVDIRQPAAPQPASYSLQQQQQSTPVPPVVAVAPPPPSASAPPAQQAAAAAPLSLDSLFGQGALATLLAGVSKPATPVPTPQPVPVAAIRSPAPQPAAAPPPQDPMALLAMLRQSGLLPPLPPTGAPSSSAPPMGAVAPPPPLPQGLPQGFPQGLDLASILSSVNKLPPTGYQHLPNDPAADIQLTHHSLKK